MVYAHNGKLYSSYKENKLLRHPATGMNVTGHYSEQKAEADESTCKVLHARKLIQAEITCGDRVRRGPLLKRRVGTAWERPEVLEMSHSLILAALT